VLQHHPDEHAGSLRPLLEAAGLALTTVELDDGEPVPALEPFDLLLVMGGPQQVWQEHEHSWLRDEKSVIRYWMGELRRPLLGVCLGHQLLAEAVGGRVGRMETPEIGVVDIERTAAGARDPVFGRLPPVFPGLQWHEAEVVEPPRGATVLAETRHSSIQAFRIGCALGVQFHVEVGPDTIPKWAAVPEYEQTLATHFGSADILGWAVEAHLDAMKAAATDLVCGLMDNVFDARVAP
jgi:GMP synthase-like glutamine amidotransferase